VSSYQIHGLKILGARSVWGMKETRDPETFAKASGHPDWDKTMNEEYCSLMENDTWDLVPLPKGRKIFG